MKTIAYQPKLLYLLALATSFLPSIVEGLDLDTNPSQNSIDDLYRGGSDGSSALKYKSFFSHGNIGNRLGSNLGFGSSSLGQTPGSIRLREVPSATPRSDNSVSGVPSGQSFGELSQSSLSDPGRFSPTVFSDRDSEVSDFPPSSFTTPSSASSSSNKSMISPSQQPVNSQLAIPPAPSRDINDSFTPDPISLSISATNRKKIDTDSPPPLSSKLDILQTKQPPNLSSSVLRTYSLRKNLIDLNSFLEQKTTNPPAFSANTSLDINSSSSVGDIGSTQRYSNPIREEPTIHNFERKAPSSNSPYPSDSDPTYQTFNQPSLNSTDSASQGLQKSSKLNLSIQNSSSSLSSRSKSKEISDNLVSLTGTPEVPFSEKSLSTQSGIEPPEISFKTMPVEGTWKVIDQSSKPFDAEKSTFWYDAPKVEASKPELVIPDTALLLNSNSTDTSDLKNIDLNDKKVEAEVDPASSEKAGRSRVTPIGALDQSLDEPESPSSIKTQMPFPNMIRSADILPSPPAKMTEINPESPKQVSQPISNSPQTFPRGGSEYQVASNGSLLPPKSSPTNFNLASTSSPLIKEKEGRPKSFDRFGDEKKLEKDFKFKFENQSQLPSFPNREEKNLSDSPTPVLKTFQVPFLRLKPSKEDPNSEGKLISSILRRSPEEPSSLQNQLKAQIALVTTEQINGKLFLVELGENPSDIGTFSVSDEAKITQTPEASDEGSKGESRKDLNSKSQTADFALDALRDRAGLQGLKISIKQTEAPTPSPQSLPFTTQTNIMTSSESDLYNALKNSLSTSSQTKLSSISLQQSMPSLSSISVSFPPQPNISSIVQTNQPSFPTQSDSLPPQQNRFNLSQMNRSYLSQFPGPSELPKPKSVDIDWLGPSPVFAKTPMALQPKSTFLDLDYPANGPN